MKSRILTALLFSLVAIPALAQTPPDPDSYELRSYAPGASAPTQMHVFPVAEVTCNQPDPQTNPGTVVNPSQVIWDDPDNAGQVCLWSDSGNGPLFSLPNGPYEGALTARADVSDGQGGTITVESLESNRAPFVKAVAPAVPGGLRLHRP